MTSFADIARACRPPPETPRRPSSVPKPLRRLGQLCMQHDPAVRPTFAVIARALLKLEQRIKAQSTGAAGKRSEAGRRS